MLFHMKSMSGIFYSIKNTHIYVTKINNIILKSLLIPEVQLNFLTTCHQGNLDFKFGCLNNIHLPLNPNFGRHGLAKIEQVGKRSVYQIVFFFNKTFSSLYKILIIINNK